jgi:uncharacterized protein (DUF1697 family)
VGVHVLMLRGINLGRNRRVPMADLRALLADGGFERVQTYVQSGNVVAKHPDGVATVESRAGELISDRFGFDVPVIARSRAQLAKVVKGDPLGDVAGDPKRYQVSFLSDELSAETISVLDELVQPPERLVVRGRELYAWHPDGVARSKLWNAVAGKGLGVTATARNWTTVTTLLQMARELE